MIAFDVVSAFPHAQETDRIFIKPPKESINDYTAKFGAKAIPQGELLWWMKKALYGRRNAGASFREFFEAVIMVEPNMSFRRGILEPCLYGC